MSSLRYIFYGGVEGAYQNNLHWKDDAATDNTDPRLLSPDYGAAIGGYKEGQLITGYLTLSGEALEIANSVPRGTEFTLNKGTPGLDFFFQQPRVGDLTEDDLLAGIRLTIGESGASLSIRLTASGGAGAPLSFIDSRSGYVSDKNEAGATIDGIWLPENVKPLALSGTNGDNELRGTAQYNFLSGGKGDDTLFLKTGQGWLWGGFGDDYLKGGSKDDFLFGGYDDDKILGRGGDDDIRGGDGKDELRGEQGDDTIRGGSGNDSVKGGSGNDHLSGQSGNDTIAGNDGADTLTAGSGNDKVDGGSGDDWIYSSLGDDILKGGSGRDLFLFSSGDGSGRDAVTDFKAGWDKITIENDLFETFEGMLRYTVQVGDDVQITYGFGPTPSVFTLADTRIAELRASDFGFSPNG